jgi:hypothetical protein
MGHILHRNYLLKHVIEGKIEGSIEVIGRRGRRLKQLVHDLKEIRGQRKFKHESLTRTLWGTRFGRSNCHKTDSRMDGFDIASVIFLTTVISVSNNYYYKQFGI